MKKNHRPDPARKALRVAGYGRVSSLRQVHEGDSIEAQKAMITRYVEMKQQFGTWEVESLVFYSEPGKSAKDMNRKELQRLVRDVEAGRIDIVICYKFDRLSRKLRDFLEFSEKLHGHGVRIVSLSEDIDTTGHGGEAMLQIMLVLAEWERKQTRERTIDAMTQRAERGLWNGGLALGYRRVEGGKGKLEPDPVWAPKVRAFFFDKFEELGSVSAVQRWLQTNGVLQPVWTSRTERVHGGSPFAEQQVRRVLANRIYLGENRWGDACVTAGAFPPVIGVEQFDRVQRRLAENVRTRANHRKPRGHGYLLKGLVRCRRCGSMMTPSSVENKRAERVTRYYRCTRQQHFAGAAACAARLVPVAALEGAVTDRLRQLSLSPDARERVAAAAVKLIDADHARFESEAAVLRQRLGVVQSEITSLITSLKAVGGAGAELLQGELDRLQAEQGDLRKRLKEVRATGAPLAAAVARAREFVAGWAGVSDLLDAAEPDEARLLVQHFVEVVELAHESADGKTGTYVLKLFPEVRPLDPPHDGGNDNGPLNPTVGERPALTESHNTCGEPQKAPRVHQLANQLLVQLGAWRVNKLRRKPTLEFYPWNPLESVLSDTPAGQSVNRDPLAKAKFYQSLLDSGVVHSRAALARYLGTSRANVTQMLRRLEKSISTREAGNATASRKKGGQ